MRLRRLDLTRYGKFTDHSIDFGPSRPGSPDLHIVYGLNEAGKSTTLAAYLDLLYGISNTSPYNFLHPYGTMRVGARLEFDGREHELARLKLRTGSLVDDRGQPVAEALLSGALGGIGRDAYKTMFSLDDQSLKEGGHAIVQSKGELGELLFSASSGLAGLSRSLVSASEEASLIYKKRASSTRLAELKRALDALKAERGGIDTLASAYATLKTAHDQAEAAYAETTRRLAEARTRHHDLTRLHGTLPAARELRRLSDALAALGPVPRPPSAWFALLPELSRDETRLQALIGTIDRTVAELTAELETGVPEEEDPIAAAEMEGLDQARVRHIAAETDLPKRRLALAEKEGALARLLDDLEQPRQTEPQTLLMPASLVGIIRDLIERHSGVEARWSAANRESAKAREALERLQREAADVQPAGIPDPAQSSRIAAVLDRIAASDLTTRLSFEERALAQAERMVAARQAELAPWSGDASALRAEPAADRREIEAWRTEATALERRIAAHRDRLRDLETQRARAEAGIAALDAGATLDDAAAHAVRAERDAAWQRHLGRLDASTAADFEAHLRTDDAVSAGRLARANDLATLRQLALARATASAEIERETSLLAEAQAELETQSERVLRRLPEILAPPSSAAGRLAALESWNLRREAALAAYCEAEAARDRVEPLRDDIARQVEALSSALTDAGMALPPTTDLADLVRRAGLLLENGRAEAATIDARAKRLAELERDLAERERDRQAAAADRERWQEDWTAALAGTWFADKAGSLAAVRAVLDALGALPALLGEREDLLGRIAAMEHDRDEFRAQVARLSERAGLEGAAADPLAAAATLAARHAAAKRAAQIRSDRLAERDKQMQARRALEAELAVHRARKAELTGFFGTDTLAAVESALQQVRERDGLEERIAALRLQIAEALRADSFTEAEQRLASVDADEVERELEELARRIEDLTDRARLLHTEMSMARRNIEAIGADDAVARIEARRRTILLEIEDLAMRHLTLRAGALAAEQALRIYRDKHRSAMMNRASEAFRMITGGNYSGLATQPDKEREILIGISRDGASKLADAMSTGTQFQLYLALRLAGYEEFAALRPPVPFVADDIMESFDNPRSEEVFRLLGEMARVGQVIYLTHHWHLCEIAERVVPEVTIHRLP
jgi:uncharacterized protein YhaN